MPEYMSDEERDEEAKESRETKKKEMSFDEMMSCPTHDCPGGPEVWSTGVRTQEGEIWCVGCPVCRGWVSQMLIPEGGDPYTEGARAWEEMRKGPEHG